MAAQYFPNLDDYLQTLLAELPEGVYAEDLADAADPAYRSYSSAEMRAAATLLAALSLNLSNVAQDKSILTATADGLTRWEQELFQDAQDSSLDIEARRQNVLAKYRSSGGISLPAIKSIVAGILGDLDFDLLPWSGQAIGGGRTGAWVLGVSPLGDGTYLSLKDPLIGNRTEGTVVPLDNRLDYLSAGLTEAELLDIQKTAYTYEVAIYGTASDQTLTQLDRQLTMYEPARASHVIRNNAQRPVDATIIQPGIYKASLPWRP